MKAYEIKQENGKYNIYYYDGEVLVDKQFHSLDGINGIIKDGYVNANLSQEALQYDKDKAFGALLLDTFLRDNRDSPIAFNPTISMQLLQKFQGVKALAEVGDIKSVRYLLMNTEVDDVFTQERKDKYVLMCSNHLGL